MRLDERDGWWNRFGRLPAIGVVASFFAAAVGLELALDEPASTVAGLVLLALLVGYCLARPAGGLDVLLIAAMPSAISVLIADAADVPRWWIALPLIPLALGSIALTERGRADRDAVLGDAPRSPRTADHR